MKTCALKMRGASPTALQTDQGESPFEVRDDNGMGKTLLDHSNTASGIVSPSDDVMTLEQFVDSCARLQPSLAAQREDSSLAVTPLITRLIVDGDMVSLTLVDGKWGAGYTRVSDLMQRSAKSWTSGGEALIAATVGGAGKVVPLVKTLEGPILRNFLSLFWGHRMDFGGRCIP